MSLKDLLFVKALGGGGGGGSSDISIANVTVSWDASARGFAACFGALCLEEGDVEDTPAHTATEYTPPYVEGEPFEKTFKVAMYKGTAMIDVSPGAPSFDIATTGQAVFDSDLNYWIVSGDCTFTITEGGGK